MDQFQLLNISAGISPVSFARFLRSAHQQHFPVFYDEGPDTDAVIPPVDKGAFGACMSQAAADIAGLQAPPHDIQYFISIVVTFPCKSSLFSDYYTSSAA